MRSQKLLPIILLASLIIVLSVPFVLGTVSVTKVDPTGGSGALQNLSNATNVSRGYFSVNITTNVSIDQANSSIYNISQANANYNSSTSGTIINGSGGIYNYTFFNFTSLTNGSYILILTLRGNVSMSNVSAVVSINFTVDTGVPTAIGTNKTNGESLNKVNFSDTTPEIRINGTDGENAQDITVRIFRNNVSFQTTTLSNATAKFLNLTTLPYNGTHEIQVEVSDTAGNKANGTKMYINIDNGAPTTVTPTVKTSSLTAGALNSASCTATDNTNGTGIQSTTLEVKEPDGTLVSVSDGAERAWPKAGEHTVTCTATDFLNQSSTNTVKFTTKGPSSGDVATTGGTTTTAAKTLASETVKPTEAVTPTTPVELKVATSVTQKSGLEKLTIEVSSEVSAADAAVEVKALDKVPEKDDKGQAVTALSTEQPAIKVIQFTPSSALSNAVKKATISFTLTDAELTAAGLTADQVVLLRFADSKWNELETKSLGNGKFEAITPGFSVFVVSKKAAAATASPTTTSSPAASPTTTSSPSPTSTTSPTAAKPANPADIWLYTGIVVAIIVIVAAVVLVMRRKK